MIDPVLLSPFVAVMLWLGQVGEVMFPHSVPVVASGATLVTTFDAVCSDASSSTLSLASHTSNTGDVILVGGWNGNYSAGTISSVTTTLGSTTFTEIKQGHPSFNAQVGAFRALAGASGAHVITINYSAAVTYRCGVGLGLSGLQNAETGTSGIDTVGSGLLTLPNITTAATSMIFAVVGSNSSSTVFTAGTDFTIPANGKANGASAIAIEYRGLGAGLPASPPNYNATMNQDTTTYIDGIDFAIPLQ